MRKTVLWIAGDGIGPEICAAGLPLLNLAVQCVYGSEHGIDWEEVLAGGKAEQQCEDALPQATLDALAQADLAIKGPLATPVSGGRRSLNVALRRIFDLYACIRPVSWIPGIPAPVCHPEQVNMVIFRENTEDVYAGIEYPAKGADTGKLIDFLNNNFQTGISPDAALGIKPMTEYGSKRLVRRAINYALERHLPFLTIVHKGNIMKFTEGAFRTWAYEVTAEFGDQLVLEAEALPQGEEQRLVIKDVIADAMFQAALLNPANHSVLATPNLNGDYLSDALAAQVGGLGIAPGVNMSDKLALFEATHGTAPQIAGKDLANPGSLILSGALLLEQAGWPLAADLLRQAMAAVIADKTVTSDLAIGLAGAIPVSCSDFGLLLSKKIQRLAD